MKNCVTVIGSLNYDTILKMSRFPKIGETLPAESATFASGGKGANQAVQAAKLGVKTYMVGCVGKDIQGDFLVNTVKEFGCNVDYIIRGDVTTGMANIETIEDGSTTCVILHGANFAITKEDIDSMAKVFDETRLVVLQMEIPQDINRYVIDLAKEKGCKVLLNAAPAAPIEAEYITKCDYFVVNEIEAGFYLNDTIDSVDKAKEAIIKLHELYPTDIVITLGTLGAVCLENDTVSFIPSIKVNAIETTGAGDSFVGGLAYATETMGLYDACVFATKCSAKTVCGIGAQPAMPTIDEL